MIEVGADKLALMAGSVEQVQLQPADCAGALPRSWLPRRLISEFSFKVPTKAPTKFSTKAPTMGSNRDFHQSLGQDPVSPLVFGLLLAPEDVPVTGARLRIFVNNRPVRDRVIAHAVAEGLHQQLLRGRQPVGVIFVRVDPATVDVNVHPTKREVRFQQSALVHDTVREAVSKGLIAHEQERGRTLFGSGNEGQTGEKFVFASSKANESETGSSGGELLGLSGDAEHA